MMIDSTAKYAKTPIILRVQDTDYNINNIVSVRPWRNQVTDSIGLSIRLVTGDVVDVSENKDWKLDTVEKCWFRWCDIVDMERRPI